MAIFSALPYTLVNGATADATQVMADFNQIVANGNANCAKNGANSDITSISGLLTPLSSIQGGTSIYNAATVGGTANDITLDGLVPTMASHNIGNNLQFVATATNTGPVTVTPTGLAAKNVLQNGGVGGTALIGGEIQVGQIIVLQYDGTQYQLITGVWPTSLTNFLSGYTLSNNPGSPTTTINIANGVAGSSGARGLIRLGSPLSKTTAAWAVGSGNGALDTGAIAGSKFYYVYIIRRSDTGVVDGLFSLAPTVPALPAGYDQYRRIGAFVTTAGSAIVAFYQIFDRFYYATPVGDVNVSAGAIPTASRTLYTVSCPPSMIGLFGATAYCVVAGSQVVYISSPSGSDLIPSPLTNAQIATVATANGYASVTLEVYVGASSQVGMRAWINGAGTQIAIYTYGWIDRRGA